MPVSGPLDGLLAREIVKYTRNNKRIRFHLTESSSENLMDLVATGIGITFIPNECVENRPDVRYIPLRNWHQALYMCILYDKWLEPPVWEFIEGIVRIFRAKRPVNNPIVRKEAAEFLQPLFQ